MLKRRKTHTNNTEQITNKLAKLNKTNQKGNKSKQSETKAN